MFLRIGLLILTCSALCLAQPWQWERVEADVYNISGFPPEQFVGFNYFNEICADYDGDGADEYFRDFGDYFVIGNLIATNPPHWETQVYSQNLSGGSFRAGAEAMHLDRDGRKELILFGPEVRCYKWVSSDPWTWERHDELLDGLWFPEETYDAALGDYDGDGLLNLVAYTGNPEAEFYERDANGVWQTDSAWAWAQEGLFFDGDFDNDGDEDFATVWLLLHLDDTESQLYENTGSGIVQHGNLSDRFVIVGPGGGDLDGDGEWEFLSNSNSGPMRYSPFGYHLQEVEPDTGFVRVTASRSLGSPDGIIEARFHTTFGQRYAVTQYAGGSHYCPWSDCFRVAIRNDLQWEFYDVGLDRGQGGPGRLSFGYLNGDNQLDVLQVAYLYEGSYVEHWFAALWDGTEQSDHFGPAIELTQFGAGQNNTFTSPQLCEVDGSFGSELAMLRETDETDALPVFYEVSGSWPNLIFSERADWSVGEWPTFELIRMADLDNDGYSELLGRTAAEWQSWFYRNGVWVEYRNILPEFTSSDLSFFDYDNDGDLDLFTLDDVYLSLSPSSADEPSSLLPEQFSLSAYPNPFNGEVRLEFELRQDRHVSLIIYDLAGRKVQTLLDNERLRGSQTLHWDAAGLTSGVYFAKLSTAGLATVTKLLLIR